MPGTNGLQLIEMIRNNLPNYAITPIIMLTAETSETVKEACKVAGADTFLTKPCDDDLLFETIYSLLGINQSSKETPAITRDEKEGTPLNNYLDHQKLDKLSHSGGHDFIRTMAEKMKDSIAGCLKESDVSKPQELQTHIHNIKGTAAFTGAIAIQNEADALLKELENGLTDAEALQGRVQSLEGLYTETCREMDDYVSAQTS
jgi:CheY-like chemotaxis protein